ncbi:MAG: pyrimidine 5'-nucleotidase [Alphaproteobacteria bacterium]|nr:pyrimidine 5'-nucleotidase [Alphaproteobacteria bacterium]
MEKFRHIDTWVFDLDNTLYDADTGVFDQIIARMTLYVCNLLGVSREEANALRRGYWEKYGTTLYGLMQEHKIDPQDFLDFAHDVDISAVTPCAVVRDGLARLPGRKVVFTNSSQAFTARMTRHLGIDRHFDGVFAIEDAGFLPKPHPETYRAIAGKFAFAPDRAAMFDDMQVNLKTAADLGMTTVWIHRGREAEGGTPPHIHHKAEKLADWLKETAPGA